MNESDKNWLRNSYHDIRFEAQKLFYPIEDGSNICMSLCVKILHIKDFIDKASDLFEKSAVSECSDYKTFYIKLRVLLLDLHEHMDYVEQEVQGGSVVKKGIERLCAVVLRDEALFGYSEEEANEEADEEDAKPVPVSYFTHYDFTLPVSFGSQNE